MTGGLPRFELSTRAFLLLLVAIPLVPVTLFAGILLSRFSDAERLRYRGAALYASERIAGAVDRELAALEAALQALSTGRSFIERAYDRFYDRAIEGKRIIGADVILKDAKGQQLINTRVAFGTALPSSLQDHEVRALRQNKPEVSDLFIGAFSQKAVISIAVPLGREGEPAYLLVIAIDPERLVDVLKAQALPEDWTATILDRTGVVIARSRAHDRVVGTRAPAEMDRRGEGADVAWVGMNADGAPALLAQARPHLAPQWRIVVGIPMAVAEAPLNKALVPLGIAGLVSLFVSGGIALWMGRRASTSMRGLALAASKIGDGHGAAPLVTPVREINLVGNAIAAAADDLAARARQRHAAEEALRKLNENLEAMIGERTAQLTQLQKLEALGQLTGGVAHDFNNLLMVILGSLELVKKRVRNDPRTQRLVDNAMQGAQRGATLTQRLLAFARRQELAPTAVDVQALVRGMSDLLRRTLGPQVDLRFRMPPELLCAKVDANQLELALLNLVVNARDAMPLGGALTIEARSEQVAADSALSSGKYTVIGVADTGVGMDEPTLRQAAEPFFTTKGLGKGTGLGLSMVHGLAQQSGGRLELRSTPGLGTQAELWLPAADEIARLGSRPQARLGHDGQTAALSILLVDDDPLVLAGTADLLRDLGHSVTEAPSGRDGLAVLESGSVDLLITDFAMPGMTGLDMIRKIRLQDPTLAVILATGFAETPDLTDLNVIRLAKPFTQNALAEAIHHANRGMN